MFRLVLLCFGGAGLAGCSPATVLHSSPPGARVLENGTWIGTTPCKISDTRAAGSCRTLTVVAPGHAPASVTLRKDWTVGGVFFNGSRRGGEYAREYRVTLERLPLEPGLGLAKAPKSPLPEGARVQIERIDGMIQEGTVLGSTVDEVRLVTRGTVLVVPTTEIRSVAILEPAPPDQPSPCDPAETPGWAKVLGCLSPCAHFTPCNAASSSVDE